VYIHLDRWISDRRLRFSSDADNVRLTNVCIIIIIIIRYWNKKGVGNCWHDMDHSQNFRCRLIQINGPVDHGFGLEIELPL